MIASTIAPPHTYAEWVSVLDMLKNRTDDEDVLQAMQNGSVEWQRAIVQALLALRKELGFLSKAINLPALPESDRQHYYQLVINQANQIQSSLVDSAKTDRSGKLASIVRNNRVNVF